jgi:sterol desaturase/sphingolipid hydroxylase (fatty acid hydroxylase superfamily)
VELFYHWNIKTPRWVGYLIQRPESHCIHHQFGLHAFNYSDLPIWDILFGTFKNPTHFEGKCGLGEENELKVKEMLLGVDVYQQTMGKEK